MKNTITLTILFITSFTVAQKTVEATDIIKDIKNGKDISYHDAIVTGDLDFTYMEDKLADLPQKKKKKWWKNKGGKHV